MSSPWTWYNEAPHWSNQEGVITIISGPKTDFWRKTHYDFIRDNGHFYWQAVRGDFVIDAKITGKYQALYDQAGLMLRVDECNWIKCGIEYVHGVQHASVVVTRDYSDWSVVPLLQTPGAIWLRVSRQREAVEVNYSLDGQTYQMIRSAYLVPSDAIQVGPMCASPEGDGFTSVFEGLTIRPLSKE